MWMYSFISTSGWCALRKDLAIHVQNKRSTLKQSLESETKRVYSPQSHKLQWKLKAIITDETNKILRQGPKNQVYIILLWCHF